MPSASLEYCPLCGHELSANLATHLVPDIEGRGGCPERESFSADLEDRIQRRRARAEA